MRLQLSVRAAILHTVPVFAFGQGGQATPGVAGASTDRTGVSTRCRRSGLQDNNLRTITFGVDLAPRDTVMFGGSYAFESYSTLQRSRQANPGAQFNDPTRDWQTDMDENVHTWSLSANAHVTNRITGDVLYDDVHGSAQYLYRLPARSTRAVPQQLPELRNRYHRLIYRW